MSDSGKHVSGPLANALYAIYRKMDAQNREKMQTVVSDLRRQLQDSIEGDTDETTRAALQAQLDRLTT